MANSDTDGGPDAGSAFRRATAAVQGTPEPAQSVPAAEGDEEIIGRIASGDLTALTELYDRYCRPAYSLARRICDDEVLAETVVLDVFTTLWQNPARCVRAHSAYSCWLLPIIHHRVVVAVRHQQHDPH